MKFKHCQCDSIKSPKSKDSRSEKLLYSNTFFPQEIRYKVHHEDKNELQEGDFSRAETPVNLHSAQLFPPGDHCCPESDTEERWC